MKRFYLLIFFFIIFIFLFLYITYNNLKSVKTVYPVEININKLNKDQLREIKIYFQSPTKGIYLIPLNLNDNWYVKNRYLTKLFICLNNDNIFNNTNFDIRIKIGNKGFFFSNRDFLSNWKKIKNKNFKDNKYIFRSPNTLYLNKSKIGMFSNIINWKGDLKVFIDSFLNSLFIIFLILFLFFIYIILKKYIDEKSSLIKIFNNELIIILFIIFISLIIKLLTLETIEISGDSVWTWFNVKALKEGLGFQQWDHHTTRMGKIIPLFLSQLIFGTKAVVYLFCPALAFIISGVMIYKIGRLIYNRNLGLIAFFFFVFFSQLTRASSQLIPSIFSIVYFTTSIYFLIKYLKNNNKLDLVISSLVLFAAYLAEITNVFFIPGIVIVLFINNKKRFKDFIIDVFIYGTILLFLFLVETFIYYELTGNILGRIGITKSTHLAPPYFYIDSFWQIFDRYLKLKGIWFIVFFTYLLLSIVLLFNCNDKIIKGLVAIADSYFLIITFTFSNFKPLELALKFNERYLDVTLILIFLVIGYFFVVWLKNRINGLSENIIYNKLYHLIIITLIVFYLAANLNNLKFRFKNNSIYLTAVYEKKINFAFENKIPIIIIDNQKYKSWKFHKTICYAFLYKKNWLINKKIKFPELYNYNMENVIFDYILLNNNIEKYINNNEKILLIISDKKELNNFILEERKFSDIINYYDYFKVL